MKVSNPLTIIAIFAGLAETLATVALVQLPPEIQEVFVYFVMAFPSGIVTLFFAVLYFKNTVLYAPSDFDDQSHYLEANKLRETVSTQMDEIFNDINKRGSVLSKEEIERAKNRVGEAIYSEAIPARAKDILKILEKGHATTSEIANETGLSANTIKMNLINLEKIGLVARQGSNYRGPQTWAIST